MGVIYEQKGKNMKKRKLTPNELLDKALGKGYREQYLSENPHGFKKGGTTTKNKKKYSRNNKHRKNNTCDVFF